MSEITFIDGTQHAKCQICGVVAELRPYGPNGEFVCFDCMKKDERAAEKQFAALLQKGLVIIK